MAPRMANGPLVTGIMATYNCGRYIRESIQAIVDQSYENWELIIVDDGSTDDTASIVSQFASTKITYLPQANMGRGAARNVALGMARGEYIAVVDADDISRPNRFETEVAYLEANPLVGIVSGQVLHFHNGRAPKRVVSYPTSPARIRHQFSKPAMAMSHAACMIRREVFEKVGKYCEECLRAQDLELFLRAIQHFEFRNIDDTVLLYRNDPSATTFAFWVRLHFYHEYASYRSRSLRSQLTPLRFEVWKKGAKAIARVYLWHGLRFVKAKVVARRKLRANTGGRE
jgi:glycosyltransferase involved in cell wall biosynthesis